MRMAMKFLRDFLVSAPQNNQIFRYRSSDSKWVNSNLPVIWAGTTTTDGSGNWSINYSSAGFSATPRVFVSAQGVTSGRGDRVFAEVTTKSATAAAGGCSRATSSSFLGLGTTLNNAPTGTVVDVLAIGA